MVLYQSSWAALGNDSFAHNHQGFPNCSNLSPKTVQRIQWKQQQLSLAWSMAGGVSKAKDIIVGQNGQNVIQIPDPSLTLLASGAMI